MRRRFDSVVTLPTDERVVGVPRCCCSATAGGSPSMSSTSGTRHLMKQTAGIRRYRLEVSPLRLSVNGAERQRRLAGAGDAGEDDQRLARNVDVDVLEVVLPGAAHPHEAVVLFRHLCSYRSARTVPPRRIAAMTTTAWQTLHEGIGCPMDAPRPATNEHWDFLATLSISSLYLASNQTYRGHCQLVFDRRHACRTDQTHQ